MKILLSPCYYKYDEITDGSEPFLAFSIGDRIASANKGSVIVTGFKDVKNTKQYTIIELQKKKTKINLSIFNAVKFNLQYFFYTSKLLKKEKFDVIQHVLPFLIGNTFNLTLLLNMHKNIPFVIGPLMSPLEYIDNDQDPTDIRNNNPKKSFINGGKIVAFIARPLLKYLSEKTLSKATKLIVVNNHTRDILLKKSIPKEKIQVIPLGIDVDKFHFSPALNKTFNSVELITVAHLVKRKGIDLTIRAFGEIVKKKKNVTLRIIGDGPQRKKLEMLVKDLGLEKLVVFEGIVPYSDIVKFYKNASLLISMSKAESWGQSYIDAMSVGLPIVATKNVGANEIIVDSQTGYLVEQGDCKNLAEKVCALLENSLLMKKFSKNARKIVVEKYDWNVIINNYLKIYKEIAKR